MELREYLQIIRKNIKLFIGIIIGIIVVGFLYFYSRPASYTTSLTLNITRLGAQETTDFKYDDFYRLQADEKFAETVVEWLKSPRTVEDILNDSEIGSENLSLRQLSKNIKPEKRSSQVILVSLNAPDEKVANNLARSVSKIIDRNTQDLNKDQKEGTWFKVIANEPVIRKDQVNPIIILAGSVFLGIFLGFWVVMVRHYLK